MRYKIFGNSGLRVSELCLGTMTFGEEWGWGASREESRRIYEAFLDAGGNFIDTANVYTEGTSEEFLGDFMEGHRERVVLATKYTNASPGDDPVDPNAAGNHRKSMVQAVEGSLRRLRTDYIDLYWVHIWDRVTPIEEVMRALDDLVRQGKVLYVGISDAPAWWVARAQTLAELRDWSPFLGIQVAYSLLERTPERELIPMAENLGLGVTAWSPLASGVLTGKYEGDGDGDEARRLESETASGMKDLLPDENRRRAVVGEVVSVAEELGSSPARVALAWLRNRSVIPIIGARKPAHVEDNLASVELDLGSEHLARLDEVSRVDLGFPAEFYEMEMVKALSFGGMRDRIDV